MEDQVLQGKQPMTLEEATAFFSEFYYGEHHIPGPIKKWGEGWVVNHDRGGLASYDYDGLTDLSLWRMENVSGWK